MRYTMILFMLLSACSTHSSILEHYHFPYTIVAADDAPPLLVQAFHTEHATYLQLVKGTKIQAVEAQNDQMDWITQGDFIVLDGVHRDLTVIARNGVTNQVMREQIK